MRNIFLLCFVLFSKILLAQFAGGTYTIGTAGGENYSSLKAACDALNAAGSISGEVIFEITTDLIEPNNVALGVTTSGIPITFRPNADADRTISFTQASANGIDVGSAPLGAWVIGTTSLSNYSSLVQTGNVTITGLPLGGSASRLTIKTSGASTSVQNYPISVVGKCDHVTLTDLSIQLSEGNPVSDKHFAVALITYKDGSGGQYAPDYFVLNNCSITANNVYTTWGFGALLGGFNGFSYLGDFPDHLQITNCNFICQGGAIYLEYFSDISITENTFSVSSTSASGNLYVINVSAALDYANIDITMNKFTLFSSVKNFSGNERLISITGNNAVGATTNISNNMFYGIEKPISSGSNNQLYVISVASRIANIYYNTIYMTNLSSDTRMSAFYPYRGMNISNLTNFTIKNNIIYMDEDDFQSVGIYYEDDNTNYPDVDESDYNNIYRAGTNNTVTGYAVNTGYQTLASWQGATGFDSHSISKPVIFASASDLHLSGSSIGDIELIGTPISGITTDIDGNTRNETYPYMGADENTAIPLPVELTSFTATLTNSTSAGSATAVVLNWQTATEVNNYGFEIERCVAQISNLCNNWETIGFVEGHGNSNSPKDYRFLDDKTSEVFKNIGGLGGELQYRLKQIDFDGNYEYSNVVEVKLTEIVKEYKLEQNYPNPFNPSTTIKYSIPNNAKSETSNVKLIVYDILGSEVATLVNEKKSAGNYEVKFDASNLASGVYIYRIAIHSDKLQSGSFVQTKKFVLMK